MREVNDKSFSPDHQLLPHTLKNGLRRLLGRNYRLLLFMVPGSGGIRTPIRTWMWQLLSEIAPRIWKREAAYQVMWDNDFTPLISLQVFDAGNFADNREKGFSFYRKVAEEGIVL
jgi:hypothetical protein